MIIDLLTQKDYCDYETCVALKELGYVWSSRYYYTQRDHKFHYDAYNKFYTVRTADAMGYVLAVHLYDAQKWLREKKKIDVLIYLDDLKGYYYYIRVWNGTWEMAIKHDQLALKGIIYNDSYEEALLEGVRASIKILQDEQKKSN